MVLSLDIRYFVLLALITICASQTTWTQQDNQIDLCFVIDRSQSIGADNWKLLLNFVENIVNKLTISNNDTRFALVTFASFGELVFGLDVFNNNTSGLIEAIRSADYYGYGTSIDNGLYTARTECFLQGNQQDVHDMAVLVTDGDSSVLETTYQAQLLRDKGVSILVIGVGDDINQDLLHTISNTDDNLLIISDFDKLSDETNFVIKRFRFDTEEPIYGSWSKYGSCSKSCGYGIQIRYRSCLKSRCSDHLTETRCCKIKSCPEKPEKKYQGLITELSDLSEDEFAEIRTTMRQVILRHLNHYIFMRPKKLCKDINLKVKGHINSISHIVFRNDDLEIANGYPKIISPRIVQVKWLASVSSSEVADICRLEEDNVLPDYDISDEYLEEALTDIGHELSKITGAQINIKFILPTKTQNTLPSSTQDVIIVVASVSSACVMATILLVVIILVMKYRNGSKSTTDKKTSVDDEYKYDNKTEIAKIDVDGYVQI